MQIYLACPYSHKDPKVKYPFHWEQIKARILQARFNAVNQAAADLMARGHIVFSPISHSHPISVQCGLPGDWEFWRQFDESFIAWCDEVHVLQLPGWDRSSGVQAEMEIARDLGKTIMFISQSIG